MISTHTLVAALLLAAASTQALYVPSRLYAREFQDSRALAARDPASLQLRSEDVLSHLIVARTGSREGTPEEGPYECKTKADCEKHIVYATHQMGEAQKEVDKAKAKVTAAGSDKDKKRKAKNELHTATESYEGWKEHKEHYEKEKEKMPSRRSEDALSHLIVARTGSREGTPEEGPYECKTKADCEKHIVYATHQMGEAQKEVDKAKAKVTAAGNDKAAKRKAKNELHTAEESLEGWKDHKEHYEKEKEKMPNRRSVDALSRLVARTGSREGTPEEGPYECKTKADCEKHIVYATHQMGEAQKEVDKAKAKVTAAGSDKDKKRKAKNELHTATESYEGWKEHKEHYEKEKEKMASR